MEGLNPGLRLRLDPGLGLSIPSGDVGTLQIHVTAGRVGLAIALEGQHIASPGLSRRRNPGYDISAAYLHPEGVR